MDKANQTLKQENDFRLVSIQSFEGIKVLINNPGDFSAKYDDDTKNRICGTLVEQNIPIQLFYGRSEALFCEFNEDKVSIECAFKAEAMSNEMKNHEKLILNNNKNKIAYRPSYNKNNNIIEQQLIANKKKFPFLPYKVHLTDFSRNPDLTTKEHPLEDLEKKIVEMDEKRKKQNKTQIEYNEVLVKPKDLNQTPVKRIGICVNNINSFDHTTEEKNENLKNAIQNAIDLTKMLKNNEKDIMIYNYRQKPSFITVSCDLLQTLKNSGKIDMELISDFKRLQELNEIYKKHKGKEIIFHAKDFSNIENLKQKLKLEQYKQNQFEKYVSLYQQGSGKLANKTYKMQQKLLSQTRKIQNSYLSK